MNNFAVIGLGQYGGAIARTLANRGAQVLAIDSLYEKVEAIKEDVAHAVQLDATDPRGLEAQNITEMDAVVVAIGENFECQLLTIVVLQEMGVKRIMGRAASTQQKIILQKMGITEIISPEVTIGQSVAEQLLQPNIHSFLPLPDDYEIVELKTPTKVCNMLLKDVSLRDKYDLNLITIKRSYQKVKSGHTVMEEHIIGVPKANTVLYATDILIMLGKKQDVDKFLTVNS
ncbi:potassium channel family protein [Aureibacter tunicatorum]|uniref:Trk system potassium uptake protein TrkA n=1 Tax=Aureibacter tunicatorum TaxID=866807 RepID=A0AAE3XL43_9BACT|nr:TrkA family potassium uptake protein [Aureibacter tunicatorum]MDR6237998.1 trk system potassium uptake protein TrkA [Aureibacter tunicatorum]BDD03031.1 potassium transporter Trk [Aureibacter tunicatorum]